MKKPTFKITIPEPCHENWEKMTPEAKGRFCQKCAKTVHDFSQKSNRQIAKTYQENGGEICGRFRESQLNEGIPTYHPTAPINRWTTAGMVLSGLLTFGEVNAQESPQLKGKVAITRVVEDPIIVGKMVPINTQTLTGKITNADGLPIPYAKINGLEVDIAVQADAEGNYTIQIPENTHKSEIALEFSADAYFSKTAVVFLDEKAEKKVNVQLMEAAFEIPEEPMMLGVVVTMEEEPSFFDKMKNLFKNKTEDLANHQIEAPAIEPTETPDLTPPLTLQPIKIIQKIYPNPFADYLKIDVHALQKETLEFVLYNEHGKSLYQEKKEVSLGNTTLEIELNHLPLVDGIYFLSVFKEGKIVQTELVVKVGHVRP